MNYNIFPFPAKFSAKCYRHTLAGASCTPLAVQDST